MSGPAPASGTITLLGPQRFDPVVGQVVASYAPTGPVATVTAGWREREPDDAELDAQVGGRSVNLGLYGRRAAIYARDRELAAAERERQEVLEELRELYVVRLHHALAAVYEIQRRGGRGPAHTTALADAIDAVRSLDEGHAARVADVHEAFHATWRLHERPAVAEQRAAVGELLAGAEAVALAGGHVDVLVACLHLFNVRAALAAQPIVAWSAGAMALTERVVVFHDRAPQGHGHAELHDAGLGLCRGLLALPHARRRLRLDRQDRMRVFARRFAPAACVLLDPGARVDCTLDGACSLAGARTLDDDGSVTTREAA